VAAAGEPDIANKLLPGYSAAGKTFKVHSTATISAICWPTRVEHAFVFVPVQTIVAQHLADLCGLRYDQYKLVFMEQPAHGLEVWMQPFVPLRAPKLFSLRADPFERAENRIRRLCQVVPSYREFPPRQAPGAFGVQQAVDKLRNPPSTN
jgi:arylsulfatase